MIARKIIKTFDGWFIAIHLPEKCAWFHTRTYKTREQAREVMRRLRADDKSNKVDERKEKARCER